MNLNDIFQGSSLKASDLNGQASRGVIASIDITKFDDGPKLSISFVGKSKVLICNKTNARMIETLYGPDTDNWIGKTIEIYPTKTEFGGKIVDCIRVRPAEPAPAAAPAGTVSDEIESDIPW